MDLYRSDFRKSNMAQNARVIPCDICDTTDDVNSFCVNCKQNHCDNCKKGHLRSASSKYHKFVSIGDGLLASQRCGDTCIEHIEQVQFFCKTCGKATCSVCGTDKHRKHDFGLINQMASGVRDKFEKATAMKEEEIENISQQISSSTVIAKYTENSQKNISTIKQTADDWMKGIRAVEKELIDREQREASDGIQRDELHIAKTEKEKNHCIKEIHDVKAKLRTCSDATLLQQTHDISRQLAAIVIPSPPNFGHVLPIISLRRPTPDAIRAMLEIQRTPTTSGSEKTAISVPPKLLDSLQEINRFSLAFNVFDIATIPDSRAWIVVYCDIMLVDINGQNLVRIKSRMRECGAVAALSNGGALYTPSDNVIRCINQDGKVSAFNDLKSYVNDILVVNDDVFVATKDKTHVLNNKGIKIKALDCNISALTSLPDGKVATIDGKENMMVIRASDCKVLNKDIDITIGRKRAPAITAFTGDQHGRIIRGDSEGNTIHVFEVEGEKATRLKDYSVDLPYHSYANCICAVKTDNSGNLWIGTSGGEVIVTQYYQSE